MPVGPSSKRNRGFILVLSVLLLLFVIIPVTGLAVDAGVVYSVKAKLQSSVDAAALAATRSMSRGLDANSQQSVARSAAARWYHANFTDGWMGTGTIADPTVTFPVAPPKTFRVSVTATVPAPTYFMKIFNINSVPIAVTAQASRRDVNIILVLDRSGSLYESSSCQSVSAAAQAFVDSFTNGRDRLGLLTFGTDFRVDYAPSTTFKTGSPTLGSTIGNLVCYGYTNAAAAYWTAYQQLVAINDQGALNVILFFTDGMPNTVTFGIAPDLTDNRLPVKKLVSPSTVVWNGLNNANASPCKDSAGRLFGNAAWNPGPLSGVLSFVAGLYKKDAPGYPASQAVDAQKIGTVEGNYGGCIFDSQFNNASTIYYGGSPSAALAGPGFPAIFDIAYLPEEDIFRNQTGAGYSGAAYAAVNRYDTSWPAAYRGKIRVDDGFRGCCTLGVDDSLTAAGVNALDNAAQRVRVDSMTRNLNVLTYAIGLGNAPNGVDNILLRRIANDPAANNYDYSKPVGAYIFSPDAVQLNQAFLRIASEVLRLTQ